MASSDSEDDEFETPSGVSVMDVRHELGDGDAESLSESALIYHLGQAENHVTQSARDNASEKDLQQAISLDAACRMIRSHKSAFVERSEAANVSKQYDVDAWIDELRSDRDDAVSEITGSDQPFLGTFGGRSSSGRRF